MLPPAPRGLRVVKQRDGLKMRWSVSGDSPTRIKEYEIQYKTVGQWVPLETTIELDHTWKTFSYGAMYKFRVVAIDEAGRRSHPSPVVEFKADGRCFHRYRWEFCGVFCIPGCIRHESSMVLLQ